MPRRFDGYFMPRSRRQAEYNRAMAAIVKRQIDREITPEQARAEIQRVTREQFPEFMSEPPEPPKDDDRDDPWDDLGPQWGGRRSKEEDSISAAAKSVTNHRSACGAKLSDKDLSRFWGKIDVKGANECWPWKNSLRGSLGYGQFRIGDKICDAHRIALELKDGPLKKGRYVCHSCDSPKCCNPRHLFAGTQKNNMDDMTEKGRGDN
jgi:hypothetical protein